MLKKGDKVVMHTCMEAEQYKGRIWTVATDERPFNSTTGKTVVWLEGFAGCFAARYLQKVVGGYPTKVYIVFSTDIHEGQILEKVFSNEVKAREYIAASGFNLWFEEMAVE